MLRKSGVTDKLARTGLAGVLATVIVAYRSIAPAQTPQISDVTLSVPGPGSGESILLELVTKLGIDREEGVALRLKFVDGGGVALDDLASGDATFAVLGLPAAMNSAMNGSRIVALAAIHDLPLYTLMVRKDLRGKVKRIEDLKGRTIGVHSSSLGTRTTSRQLAELVLRAHGVSLEDVRLVADGQTWATKSAGLKSGEVDATMCDEPLGEELAWADLAFPLFATGSAADAKGIPGGGFLRGALISSRTTVVTKPDISARMVRIIKRGLEWAGTHDAEQMATALALPAGRERAAIIRVWKKYPRQFSHDGGFSEAQLRETDIFFRASAAIDPKARNFSVREMIVSTWAGIKP